MRKKAKKAVVKKAAIKILPHEALILEKLPGYFLLVCLILSTFLLYKILTPFITVIFSAAVLSTAFYPVFKKIRKAFNGWDRVASLLTCFLVVILTVVPISILTVMLTGEGVETYEMIETQIDSGDWDKYLSFEEGSFVADIKAKLEGVVDLETIDIKGEIISGAQTLSSFMVTQTASLLTSLSSLLLNFVLMIFSMFYFFKDGEKIVERVGEISPLPTIHENQLFKKLGSMVKAIMLGVFLTAIAQGFVGGIGFAIAGISSPVFWGAAMAFFSLVPMIGTAVIWVPAAIILAVMGNYGLAIFIVLWGVLAVGSIDNVLRPYLIGGKAHTYPLLTFFVILGGVFTMGFKGIIIGPLVLMALMSFLHIYETEYHKVLKK
jgi:predicted PurR-regulated permease PerM